MNHLSFECSCVVDGNFSAHLFKYSPKVVAHSCLLLLSVFSALFILFTFFLLLFLLFLFVDLVLLLGFLCFVLFLIVIDFVANSNSKADVFLSSELLRA